MLRWYLRASVDYDAIGPIYRHEFLMLAVMLVLDKWALQACSGVKAEEQICLQLKESIPETKSIQIIQVCLPGLH